MLILVDRGNGYDRHSGLIDLQVLVLVAGGTHHDGTFRVGVLGGVVEGTLLLNLRDEAGLVDR